MPKRDHTAEQVTQKIGEVEVSPFFSESEEGTEAGTAPPPIFRAACRDALRANHNAWIAGERPSSGVMTSDLSSALQKTVDRAFDEID
ncbi:MAG: hypothetical protein ACYSWU_15120 [Planctomycetota bacterium]